MRSLNASAPPSLGGARSSVSLLPETVRRIAVIDFLGSAAIGILFVTTASALMLGSYLAARRVLHPGAEGDRTSEVASNVAVRIAALHGLILALVYAQELDDYKDVRNGLNDEAIAISDVFNDVRRYGGLAVEPVQQGLARYVATVVDQEWDALGRGDGLSAQAWIEWDAVYERLLDLEPATERERFLGARMRDRITTVAQFRQSREATAEGRYSELFWAPALLGLILLAIPIYVYRPTRTHVVLVSLFAIYSGIILFLIYGFSNPFAPPGRLPPSAFQRLLDGDLGKALPTSR